MSSLPPLNPDFHSQVWWEAVATGPPVVLERSRFKDLRALGHKVERFLAARAACSRHIAKAAPEIATPFLLAIGRTLTARIRADNKRYGDSVKFSRAAD